MSDVSDVLEHLDLAVALAEGHVPTEELARAGEAARRARDQVGHLGATLVVALLGGTGSGKSSLLNALAGEQIASAGVLRPHSTEPTAWLPHHPGPALTDLLDSMEVRRRVTQRSLPGIAILDLWDVDSVVTEHRRKVEELLPRLDVAVWVLDPVKYADTGLHRGLIAGFDGSGRLLFVLNKIDTISAEERGAVRRHLVDLLAADGVEHPTLFETAADPTVGPPLGVDLLLRHLAARLDDKRVRLGRLLSEVRAASHGIGEEAGVLGGGSLGFEERWGRLREELLGTLASSNPSASGREGALRAVEHFVARLSADAGGPLGERIRRLFPPGVVEAGLDAALDAAEPQPRKRKRRGEESGGAEWDESLAAELEARLGDPLRELLWERASLGAVLAALAVDAEAAGVRLLPPEGGGPERSEGEGGR